MPKSLFRLGLLLLQRGTAIRRRLGVRSPRKLREEIAELIETGSSAEPRPHQVLEPSAREPLGHAAREAREVIAELLRAVARLDEIPVGQLLGLADLVSRQPGNCGEPRMLLVPARLLFRLALLLGSRICGRFLSLALLLRLRSSGRLRMRLAERLDLFECPLKRLDKALRIGAEPFV